LEEEQLGDGGDKGCMSVAKHIDECAACRTRLEQIFLKLFKPTNEVKKTGSLLGNIGDLLIIIGIGFLVIFILHGFVKLGRLLV
jgi:hypothetical protein